MDKIQSDKGSSPLYAEGYRRVQSQLEKQIKLGTNVYSKWNIAKDISAKENCLHETDSNNSDFANALLKCKSKTFDARKYSQ